MPLPVELLYRLTDRDAALPQWGFMSRTLLAQGTGTSLITDLEEFRSLIPEGYLLNVTRLGVNALPGIGRTVLSEVVIINDNPGPSQQNVVIEDPLKYVTVLPAFVEPVSTSDNVDLVLGTDEYGLQAAATFSGTVEVNSVRLIFSGYILPRGNFARF